ncbi:hypothetical protein G9A89_018421 [Geosiphon pyriformis]|nr:hypothetical protein G9A89_018421 [Geosiphon pyriformis]
MIAIDISTFFYSFHLQVKTARLWRLGLLEKNSSDGIKQAAKSKIFPVVAVSIKPVEISKRGIYSRDYGKDDQFALRSARNKPTVSKSMYNIYATHYLRNAWICCDDVDSIKDINMFKLRLPKIDILARQLSDGRVIMNIKANRSRISTFFLMS